MFAWTIPVTGWQTQGPPNVVEKGVGKIVQVIDCKGGVRPGANLNNITHNSAYEVFNGSPAASNNSPGN